MTSLDGTPRFDLIEDEGELRVQAIWTIYTPEELNRSRWRADAGPQRSALDACLIAVACHRRSHPGDSVDFLHQELEVAVRSLEAGSSCVPVCGGAHQVRRDAFLLDLTLAELLRAGNPFRVFWSEWRPDRPEP